jgi:Tfp pilus assembly protein PilN
MIEINLLPGAGKKKSRGGGGGPKLDVGAMVANLRERIRQPWLIAAIATTAVALLAVGFLFTTQNARERKVTSELQKAVQDSTRYASVLKERETAASKRDTVLRSLNLIRAIDDDRFIWPHIMQEVSKHLPPYTWIVSMGITGPSQGSQAVTTVAAAAPAEAGKRKRALPTVIARDSVRIRLVGNTVDIQALTRFMKELESSPFLEQVQLAKSERANDNGKEVTQFQLDMMYTRPDPSQVTRVPLAVSVR